MKRRILALACAVTLVLGMSLTVCASDSDTAPKAAAAAQAEYSSEETVTIANATGQSFSAATILEFSKTTTIASGVSGASISAVPVSTAKNMIAKANELVGSGTFIASVVELNVPAGTGTATFTINCSNVWSGQNVSILHLKSDGTYEMIKADSVANGSVTFTMTSYSPIAIVIDTSSPKTGEE